MPAGATNIQRLWDLTEAHIRAAIGERRTMGNLLRDLAAIARPGAGAPKILIAIARMAEPTCDWLEGSLRVEISCFEGQAAKTQIMITEDLGGGVLEVVFPRLVLDVPIVEFERSLRLAPRAVEPLKLKLPAAPPKGAPTPPLRLILMHKKTRSTKALPSFEVAEDCLRRSLPPTVRKSLMPLPERVNARTSKEPVLKRRVRSVKPEPPPPPKEKSWRPVIAGQDAEGKPMMLEIPRPPKILDFGDLLPPKSARSPSAPAPAKRPSRSPPVRR